LIAEVCGIAPASDQDPSVRQIVEYDWTDHPVLPEQVVVSEDRAREQIRSPRPIFMIDRSDQFFYRAVNGGRGATGFPGSRGDPWIVLWIFVGNQKLVPGRLR
jgi:hypothetical protein